MLLALNAFQGSSTPTPSTNRTPIGLLLALTRRGAEVAPPATNRTPIGLLLVWTRPSVAEPPIEPPVEIPPPSYAGEIAGSRGRMIRKFRKRKREELEELLEAIGIPVEPPVLPPVPPLPEAPPAPGLMADMPTPPRTVLRSPPDEDEDEIALLLELLS